MVTIPDPRFEAPELLEPGRKPTGNVVIDWSHPFGKHITTCLIFKDGVPYDLAQGEMFNTIGSPTYNGKTVTTDKANPDRYVSPSASKLGFTNNQGTYLAKFLYVDSGDGEGVISNKLAANWVDSTGMHLGVRNSDHYQIIQNGASISANTTTAASFTEFGTVAAIYESGIPFKFYINGVFDTAANVLGTPTTYSEPSTGLYIAAYHDLQAKRHMSADIEYIFTFNKAFSAEQIADLYRNPYQFLIPA